MIRQARRARSTTSWSRHPPPVTARPIFRSRPLLVNGTPTFFDARAFAPEIPVRRFQEKPPRLTRLTSSTAARSVEWPFAVFNIPELQLKRKIIGDGKWFLRVIVEYDSPALPRDQFRVLLIIEAGA